MTEADTLYITSYIGYTHSYICQKMLKNIHSSSLSWIMHSGPFLFPDVNALGKMQMASIWNNLEPADKGEK